MDKLLKTMMIYVCMYVGVVPMHWRTTTVLHFCVHFCVHFCGIHLMGNEMYVCMYVYAELVTMNGHGWDGIQCPLLASEKTLKRVEYNCIGDGGSYKGGAVPPTDLRGIAQ